MYDEYEHPLAEPGYQSDTGTRDTPTLQDFVNYTRVEEIHGKPRSKKAKVMNRKGRAICRIMATHGWAHADIGYVFRISEASVKRAVDNRKYNPRDRVEEDKERAGPDFHSNLPMPPSDERRAELRKLDDSVPKASKVIYLVSDDSSDSDSSEEPPKDQLPDEAVSPPLFPYQRKPFPVAPVKNTGPQSSAPPSGSPKRSYDQASFYNSREVPESQNKRRSIDNSSNPLTNHGWNGSSPFLPRTAPKSPSTPISGRHRNTTIPSPLPPPSSRKPLPLPLPPVPTHPHPHPHPHSHHSPTPTPDPDPALPSFLQTISDIDYTPHLALLALQGFTLARMRTLSSTWSREEMHEALEGLLMGRGAAAVGQPGMRAIASVSLEIAIRGLKQKQGMPGLPPSGSSSGTTLPSFLQNVMGLDLSPHLQLFEEQDLDMRMLGAMVRWDRERREETLKRVLLHHNSVGGNGLDSGGSNLNPKRMTALEVVGLEFCLRRAGGEVRD